MHVRQHEQTWDEFASNSAACACNNETVEVLRAILPCEDIHTFTEPA
jgi:hypothetical protein